MSGSVSVEKLLRRLDRLEAAVAERDAVIADRDARIVVLTRRVAELEALLRKDSRTSSKPPSSDGLRKPPPRSRRESSGRPPGKQPGAPGATLRQVDRPDEVVVHAPAACRGCGNPLHRAPVTSVEARQVLDLPPIRLRVTEHRLQHRRCPCGTVTMATAPAEATAPVQYGPRVRAVAAYLVGYQHLPYQRARETLTDLLGVTIATGTLTSIVESTGTALAPFLHAVREQLITAPVAHFDETGLRVAGRTAWVHSASTETLALFTVHPTRGQDAMTDAGVLPHFTGTAVHDGWTPYRRYGTNRQLCNAHHLRDLAAVLDLDPTQTWATDMTRLLCEIHDMTRTARTNGADTLAPRLLAAYHRRYHAIITAAHTTNPQPTRRPTRPPQHPTAQPPPQRQRRTPAINLLARLHGFANDVLRFAHDLTVPFDNNLAERDIRMVKLRQKISGGLRTWTGATTFCTIRSYLATTRKHGINALEALTQLHNGNPWMPPTTT